MNVLSVIHYPGFGGPYNSNMRIIPKLAETGIRVSVLIPDEPGDGRARLLAAGVDVIAIPLHRLRAVRDPGAHISFLRGFSSEVARIRKIIRERAIDVVMINGLVNPHGAIAARLENTAVVWQFLDTRPGMTVRKIIMPLVLRLSDVLMSTGMKVASVHPGAESFGERLISFFPPVDTQKFVPSPDLRTNARRELGVPEEAFLVGTVGNVNAQKGYEYLIRAAAELKSKIPELRVRVVGSLVPTHARYQEGLNEEASRLGLVEDGCLRFCGPHSAVETIVPAFDVFVMSAVPLSEGITTSVLEAMSCGVPVVTTDVGAVSEAVREGVDGFLVPPLDPRALAGAVERLHADPGLRARMGDAARARAVEFFDAASSAKTHARAFHAAIAHRKGEL